MSQIKHTTFAISITNNVSLEEASLERINKFLAEENVVYINHSIAVLQDSFKDNTGRYKTVNNSIVVSLIYKDLTETSMNLKKVSKKTATSIKESVREGDKLPMPPYQTDFEKKNK